MAKKPKKDTSAMQPEGNIDFPLYAHYPKNSLRPNPQDADPSRGDLAYAKGPSVDGDFGGWDATVRPALGLPTLHHRMIGTEDLVDGRLTQAVTRGLASSVLKDGTPDPNAL